MKTMCAVISVFLGVLSFSPMPVLVEDERCVPVIMYHSVCNTGINDYVLSPTRLKSDFGYLKDRGYTPVFITEITDYCEGRGDLPDKPVVITFDDGFYNNYFYALKIAREYGFKITVGIVGSYSDKEKGATVRSPVYSYLNDGEIKAMYGSGFVQFANHSYDMHRLYPRKGVNKRKGESTEDYARVLTADSEKCRKLITDACGCEVNTFAFPYGSYCKDTVAVLRGLGYKAMLTCRSGINKFKKGSGEGLCEIMRFNRSGNMTTETFFGKIKVA